MSETSEREQLIRSKNAAACPTVKALTRVGTPWRLNVLYALEDAELRFNELKRATAARAKTLSDTVSVLEENGLVERRTRPTTPDAVSYRLTVAGRELLDNLEGISRWAVEHVDEVEAPPRADEDGTDGPEAPSEE